MILKVIYKGFKSFADTIEVDFAKGLTTVIGPNGCGKSNIVDGIRWVLGEQSAKSLRGGKMEDIIFHGTAKRSKSDMAEVTLILDNSKGTFKQVQTEQVSVTRRAFRKGGSEYLINGEISRLKDLQNLFLDSGIGSRSYSLIGQEQAKKILSTDIKERRAIFEEAAGIVKFKQQKEETEKNLAKVEQNLTRMEDIIHELEKQLNPLRKQSEKAARHKEISSSLLGLEVQYLLNQYDALHNQVKELTSSISKYSADVQSLEERLFSNESKLEELKVAYQENNEDIFSSQSSLSSQKEEIDKIESTIQLLSERIQNSEFKISETQTELSDLEAKHSMALNEYNQKKERFEFVKTSLLEKQTELNGLQTSIDSVESDKLHVVNDYEHFRNKVVELYNRMSQKQYERNQLKERESELKEKQKVVDQSLADIKNEYQSYQDVYTKLQSQYDELASQKEQTSSSLQENQKLVLEKQQAYDNLFSTVKDLQQKQFQLKTKIDSIETFIENNEGFFDGAKSILSEKKKGNFKNVVGVIAELIKVEKKYEIALDNLLQSTMQSIVTIDDESAKECISYLTKNKLGRATFLPINMAQSSGFSKDELQKIENTPGIILSTDGITFSDQLKPVILSKLGRSLIAESLTIGLDFIKKTKIKARISTVDGELIQLGSITGGASSRKRTNFFTKKRELEDYKQEDISITASLHEHSESLNALKDAIEKLNTENQTLSENLTSYINELNAQYNGVKDAENNYHRIHEKHQDLLTEQEEIKVNLRNASTKIIDLKFELEQTEKEHDETNQKLENLHSEKETQDGSLSSMLKNLNDTQTLVARLEEEMKQLTLYLDSQNQQTNEVVAKVSSMKQRIEEETKSIDKNRIEITTFKDNLLTLRETFDGTNQHLSERRGETQSALDEINQLESSIKQARQEKENVEKELHKLQVQFSKQETEIEAISNRLLEDYEMDNEIISTHAREQIDMKSAKKEVEQLRKELSSLGNINQNAIDDFKELQERYNTESTQFQDAKKAKEDLVALITSIEEEMTVKFTTTFYEIASIFEKTFTDLFEGGNAKLRLADEKNPLTSEIEIIAQPPGKVAKSISLLSGGEQSLSAVALIFAIILAKPSPFVILDEVDAPLDDANVARFSNYLKKLSQESQFIVITHRKGTKMVSDFMYGVTHEELGVSVVAAVKLDFNEKTG
ncbi:chromosome segregation protein SMC [Priestia megaterium]|nr:chromosome segregation protein SMC [Priestia megaterium]